MKTNTILHHFWVFMFACLINAAILLWIQQASHSAQRVPQQPTFRAIQLTEFELPREQKPERPIQKMPLKEKPLPKVPTVTFKNQRSDKKPAEIAMKLPRLSFDIQPKLQTGFSIAPPEPEISISPPIEQPHEVEERAPVKTVASPAQPALQKRTEYGMDEVDKTPEVVHKIEPIYPNRARRRNLDGMVEVKFLVSASGEVKHLSIIRAKPEGVFEKSVLDAVGLWKFTPGYYKGQAVATWVTLPIHFKLSG